MKGNWGPLSLEVALEVEASDTVAMVLAKLRKQESSDAAGLAQTPAGISTMPAASTAVLQGTKVVVTLVRKSLGLKFELDSKVE